MLLGGESVSRKAEANGEESPLGRGRNGSIDIERRARLAPQANISGQV